MKETIKNFYNWIISFICWQDKLNTELLSNHQVPKDSTKTVKIY
jgi:hypothetical protein